MGCQTDLTNKQWDRIKDFFAIDGRMHNSAYTRRSTVNAILYVTKGGIPWRMLPKKFPPWNTVYRAFSRWSENGLWDKILTKLLEEDREAKGKKKT